jgi:hypothetical protein
MAGFFNTNWDLGNMFNSPYSNTGFYNQDEDDSIVPRPGNEGPEAMPTNTWGAPTGYDPSQQQQGNMFNPYSTGNNNNFYNPYQFGQTTSGTQYGGGQQPWWMNYNMGNSAVNPPNIPTTNVQPQAQGQPPRNQGTGPDGKDLTYAETIKYFGLYDGAENAFAAGDKQAAYRQDHMQWRSGTGAWEGNGKQEGQSDLDYPGRTTDAGDVIMGDRQKLTGMFGGFDPFSMFNSTANEQGGTDYTVADNGTMVTGDGTTVETQLTNQNNIPPMFRTSGDGFPFGLKRGAFNNPDIFYPNTNTTPFGPAAPTAEQRNWIRNNNTYVANDDSGTFSISDIPNSYSNIRGGDRSGPAVTGQYSAGPAEMTIAQVNALGGPDGQARYEAGLAETAAARVAAEKQAAQQEQANIFLQNSLAEQKAREAAQKVKADKAAQDRQDAARRQNNNYETGPVPKNIFTAPKASTGYKTKDVNNSFAARRDIRNIFA